MPTWARWFLLYLVFGFLVDLGGWLFYKIQNPDASWVNRYIYELVESMFFVWLVRYITNQKTIRKICNFLFPLFGLMWIISTLSTEYIGFFRTIVGVIVAFLSGFLLLELVEAKKSKGFPIIFWIILGVFFYNFCTFFIMALINTEAGLKVWWIQNSINITTNVIFGVGFWVGVNENQKHEMSEE